MQIPSHSLEDHGQNIGESFRAAARTGPVLRGPGVRDVVREQLDKKIICYSTAAPAGSPVISKLALSLRARTSRLSFVLSLVQGSYYNLLEAFRMSHNGKQFGILRKAFPSIRSILASLPPLRIPGTRTKNSNALKGQFNLYLHLHW